MRKPYSRCIEKPDIYKQVRSEILILPNTLQSGGVEIHTDIAIPLTERSAGLFLPTQYTACKPTNGGRHAPSRRLFDGLQSQDFSLQLSYAFIRLLTRSFRLAVSNTIIRLVGQSVHMAWQERVGNDSVLREREIADNADKTPSITKAIFRAH